MGGEPAAEAPGLSITKSVANPRAGEWPGMAQPRAVILARAIRLVIAWLARSTARWLTAIGLVGVSVLMPSTARAFWTEDAAGSGTATVAVLPPVVVTADSPVHSDRVELSWSAPALPSGMAVDGPVAGLQIGLDRGDQPVDPRIEHGAAVEIDDPMGAPLVVAGPQPALAVLQGNDGPIAVAEVIRGGQQGAHGGLQAADALQGGLHPPLFPVLLAVGGQGLQGAAAAAFGQDAGGTASLGGGAEHRQRFRQPVAPGPMAEAHLQPFTGQAAGHEHHRPPMAADATPLLVEVLDLQLQLGPQPQGWRGRRGRGHRPEAAEATLSGSAGGTLQRAVTPSRPNLRKAEGAR